jgi:hypothetical protein
MIKFFSLILLIQFIFAEEKFNYFKSYSNSENKPPNYSREKKHLRHSIDEYLDPKQKRIHKIRNSIDTPDVMFDSKWSGFNK